MGHLCICEQMWVQQKVSGISSSLLSFVVGFSFCTFNLGGGNI